MGQCGMVWGSVGWCGAVWDGVGQCGVLLYCAVVMCCYDVLLWFAVVMCCCGLLFWCALVCFGAVRVDWAWASFLEVLVVATEDGVRRGGVGVQRLSSSSPSVVLGEGGVYRQLLQLNGRSLWPCRCWR